jgi:hypothetical protein
MLLSRTSIPSQAWSGTWSKKTSATPYGEKNQRVLRHADPLVDEQAGAVLELAEAQLEARRANLARAVDLLVHEDEDRAGDALGVQVQLAPEVEPQLRLLEEARSASGATGCPA